MIINPRFNGPPGSANGGYACGLLACDHQGAVEVTLRRPPPLGQRLHLVDSCLFDGQDLVAEARPVVLDLDVPEPPSAEEAREASGRYAGHQEHPFPTCFVCGTLRPASDGLGLFAGPLAGRNVVAAEWTPAKDTADENGLVKSQFLWCALDCPGAWSMDQGTTQPHVLGRLTASIEGRLKAGQPAIVIGWPLGRDGRKAFAGTAVFDHQRQLVARARAVWFAV